MSLLLDTADTLEALIFPQGTHQERTCEGCNFLVNEKCSLWSGVCVNSPYKPYFEPKVVAQQ